MNILGIVVVRIVTLFLGAVPATGMTAMAVAAGFAAAGPGQAVVALFVLAPMAIWGTFSLWRAALGPLPVRQLTATGLVAGLIAALGYRELQFYTMVLLAIPPPILRLMDSSLVVAPAVIASCHLIALLIIKANEE